MGVGAEQGLGIGFVGWAKGNILALDFFGLAFSVGLGRTSETPVWVWGPGFTLKAGS